MSHLIRQKVSDFLRCRRYGGGQIRQIASLMIGVGLTLIVQVEKVAGHVTGDIAKNN